MNNIPPQLWMQLEKKVREHLIGVFGLMRTGITEIVDDRVITDGYSNEDLKVITLAKMNEYIGSEETDLLHAWAVTCSKAKYELNPPPIDISTPVSVETTEIKFPTNSKQNGTTKKS